MLASPNFRIQRVEWKFKSTLQERTVIDRALVSLSDCWIFGPSQLTRFTRHKIKLKSLFAHKLENMRGWEWNLICRSMRFERRRNSTNQQLQSFLACFPETIVNLLSRMETIFQKGKRILIVQGKSWLACIISTSLRGGFTSLPSSATTSPSTQIFGIMHGQHNLHDDQQVSPFL